MRTTTAEETERLRIEESVAQQRYEEAIKRSDMAAARNAADDWFKAADAFIEYVGLRPYFRRGRW
jgi:hypothetical protein